MPSLERSGLAPGPLRVTIDLSPAVQEHGGIGRYAHELALELSRQPEGRDSVEVSTFVVDPKGRPLSSPLDRRPGRRMRIPNKLWRARVAIGSFFGWGLDDVVGASDVFHGTDHLLPPLRRAAGVLTIHDLSFLHLPHTHMPMNRTYLRVMMPRFVRAADAIVTDSEWTRRDVLEAYAVPPERVTAVHLGVGPHYSPRPAEQITEVRKRYGLPPRYLLSVGTLEPRKNLRTLLAAFAAARVPELGLALVGPAGWRLEDAIGSEAGRLEPGIASRVLRTGRVPESDLPALYSGAEAFCFPSLYEGFGLPVLEAMACGAPVVASRTSSLPEVVGGAGLLLPPLELEAWVEAIRSLTSDTARRARMSAEGQERARRFSWQKTGERTLVAYREAHARRA